MRLLFSIVAILVLLVTALPAMACATDRAMSHEESACCRAMHNQCDGMATQGCCRMDLRTGERPQLLTAAPHTDIHWAVFAQLVPSSTLGQGISLTLQWQQTPAQHPPPGLVAAKTTVLRI